MIRLSDERRLALKVTRQLEGTPLARLAREAQIASHVTHPNVVGILDVDVDPSGFLYLVLEYVDGPTLRTLRERFADVAWAMSVLGQTADGLAALHAHGVVHRDLKPSNVMVEDAETEAPIVKLTDFGVSRLVVDPETSGERARPADEPSPPVVPTTPALPAAPRVPQEDIETRELKRPDGTRSETPKTASSDSGLTTDRGRHAGGHAELHAPELALEAALTPAADMFSFGVMAFELLSGEQAFRTPPALSRLEGRSIRPPPSLALHRPDLDATVVELADCCLSTEPAQRPTAAEMARALASLASSRERGAGALTSPLNRFPRRAHPRDDDLIHDFTPLPALLAGGALIGLARPCSSSPTAASPGSAASSGARSRRRAPPTGAFVLGLLAGCLLARGSAPTR